MTNRFGGNFINVQFKAKLETPKGSHIGRGAGGQT